MEGWPVWLVGVASVAVFVVVGSAVRRAWRACVHDQRRALRDAYERVPAWSG